MSKVLFLCSDVKNASGNCTTISRLKQHIENYGCSCSIINTQNIDHKFWEKHQENVLAVFAIHALHCVHALEYCQYQIVLIFGGTDLNEYSKEPTHSLEMTKVVNKALFCITFGRSMTDKAKALWPLLNYQKLKEITQSVETKPSSFDLKRHLLNNKDIFSSNIFLLVAGIRPIKDPLYLLSDFAKWHQTYKNCYLVIVGNNRNKGYYETVCKEVNNLKGIILLPEMERNDILACMTQSYALVNSSLSEGMSNAILEAMSLNLPVIARNIQGNRDLIDHGVTGLLYNTPQEFILQAQLLMENIDIKNTIIKNSKLKIVKEHSIETEAKAYHDILSSLGKKSKF